MLRISHRGPAMFKSCVLPLTFAMVLSASLFAQTNQSKVDNEQHRVRLETDSGRYGVGTAKLDPKQLGVAIYPGAKVEIDGNNDGKGANFSLDWGEKSTRLYV